MKKFYMVIVFLMIMLAGVGKTQKVQAWQWGTSDADSNEDSSDQYGKYREMIVVFRLKDGTDRTIRISYTGSYDTGLGVWDNTKAYEYYTEISPEFYNVDGVTLYFPVTRNVMGGDGDYNYCFMWTGDYINWGVLNNGGKWGSLNYSYIHSGNYNIGWHDRDDRAIGGTRYRLGLGIQDAPFSNTSPYHFIYFIYGSRYRYEYGANGGNPDDLHGIGIIGFVSDIVAPTVNIVPNGYNGREKQRVVITAADNKGGSGLNPDNVYEYYISTSDNCTENGRWCSYDPAGTEVEIGAGTHYIWTRQIHDNAIGGYNYSEVSDSAQKLLCSNAYVIYEEEEVPNRTCVTFDANGGSIAYSNSLGSYIAFGRDLGPVFDPVYYAGHNSDIPEMYRDDPNMLFRHFCSEGIKNAAESCANFSAVFYRDRYSDVRAWNENNFDDSPVNYYMHYISWGIAENRIGSEKDLGTRNKTTGMVQYMLTYGTSDIYTVGWLAPGRLGWKFTGWYTEEGIMVYDDMGSNVPSENFWLNNSAEAAQRKWKYTGQNLNLYAHWKPVITVHHVKYDEKYGIYEVFRTDSAAVDTGSFFMPEYVMPPDNYHSWCLGYTEADGKFTEGGCVITGSVDFYVYYVPDRYTITFQANEGTVAAEGGRRTTYSAEVTYGTSEMNDAGSLNPLREGYTFIGWYTKEGEQVFYGDEQSVFRSGMYKKSSLWNEDGRYILADSVTVYAHWMDNMAPVIQINKESCNCKRYETVTITVSDSGDGLAENYGRYVYFLSNEAVPDSAGTLYGYTSGTEFTIGEGLSGAYYIFIMDIQDKEGNISSRSGDKIYIDGTGYHRFGLYYFDNIPPEGKACFTENNMTLGLFEDVMQEGFAPYAEIAVTELTDNLAGISKVYLEIYDKAAPGEGTKLEMSKDNEDYYCSFNMYELFPEAKTVVLCVWAVDKAGNTATVPIIDTDWGIESDGDIITDKDVAWNKQETEAGIYRYERDGFRVEARITDREGTDASNYDFRSGEYAKLEIYTYGRVEHVEALFPELTCQLGSEWDEPINLDKHPIPLWESGRFIHDFRLPLYCDDGCYDDIVVRGYKGEHIQSRFPGLRVKGSILDSVHTILKY